MSFHNVTAIDAASSDTTVVWALRTRESILGPAIWPAVMAKEGILLLKTKPELVLGIRFHQPCGLVTVVEFVGASIRIPGLTHHNDVGLQAKRIGEDRDGADVDIGVPAWGLAGRRAVEIPFGQLFGFRDRLEKSLRIKPTTLVRVKPQGIRHPENKKTVAACRVGGGGDLLAGALIATRGGYDDCG